MKKIAVIIGTISALTLTGCSLSSTPAPVVTITESSTTCRQLASLAHDLIIDLSDEYVDTASKAMRQADGTGILTQADIDKVSSDATRFTTQLKEYTRVRTQCNTEQV